MPYVEYPTLSPAALLECLARRRAARRPRPCGRTQMRVTLHEFERGPLAELLHSAQVDAGHHQPARESVTQDVPAPASEQILRLHPPRGHEAAETPQGRGLDLPYALARHPELASDGLQGHGLLTGEAEAPAEHVALRVR